MTEQEARDLLQSFLGPTSTIRAGIEEGDKFLFIAHRINPLEGEFDPFFSVDKETKEVRDFSPQNYSDPLAIITRLQEVYV